MRKLLFFLLLPFLSHAQNGYVLDGATDTSLNGKFMYLYGIDYSQLNPKLADSVLVTNGRFRFTGSINTPAQLVSVYSKDHRFFHQLMLENRKMQIEKTGEGYQYTVSNSPITDQYKAWKNVTDRFSRERHFIYKEIDSLTANKAPDSLITALNLKRAALSREERAVQLAYIAGHPDQYISMYWLRYSMLPNMGKDIEKADSAYKLLTASLQKSAEGKLMAEEIAVIKRLAIGAAAPRFEVKNDKGQLVKLEDFRGKYLLLDFWASWCAPCIESIPYMKKLYAEYKDKGLEVLGISLDDKEERWLGAIKKYALPWPNVSELKGWDGSIGKQYNIRAIPQHILLDKEGKIVGVDIDPEEYLAKILQH